MATMLYHPHHAPKGKTFEETKESLKGLEADGWVDDPAKIGVNAWSDQSPEMKRHIQKKMDSYMGRRVSGIEGGSENLTNHTRCPIWTSIASYGGPQGDGEYFDSPRAGGRYYISR